MDECQPLGAARCIITPPRPAAFFPSTYTAFQGTSKTVANSREIDGHIAILYRCVANLTVYLLKVSNSRRVDRHLRYPGKLRRLQCGRFTQYYATRFQQAEFVVFFGYFTVSGYMYRTFDAGDMPGGGALCAGAGGAPHADARRAPARAGRRRDLRRAAQQGAGQRQELTLVRFSAQRKHILWDTLGA